jgi:hypothetical protein
MGDGGFGLAFKKSRSREPISLDDDFGLNRAGGPYLKGQFSKEPMIRRDDILGYEVFVSDPWLGLLFDVGLVLSLEIEAWA